MAGDNEKHLILIDSDGELEDAVAILPGAEQEPVEESSPNALVVDEGELVDEDSEEWEEVFRNVYDADAEDEIISVKSDVTSSSQQTEESKTKVESDGESDALTEPQTEEEIGDDNETVEVGNVVIVIEEESDDNGSMECEVGSEDEEDSDMEMNEQENEDNDVENDFEPIERWENGEPQMNPNRIVEDSDEEANVENENVGKRKANANEVDNGPPLKKQKTEDAPSNDQDENSDPEMPSSPSLRSGDRLED